MKRRIEVQRSEGCYACPFEHGNRCLAMGSIPGPRISEDVDFPAWCPILDEGVEVVMEREPTDAG